MSLWGLALKGDIDHIELVFVNNANNSMIAYFITVHSAKPLYVERDFTNLYEKCVAEWYLLNISFDDEMVLREFCQKRVDDDIAMSVKMMMMSGLPDGFDFIATKLINFVDQLPENAKTRENVAQEHFCASLTLEALKQLGIGTNLDMRRITANDLVLYLKKRNLLQKVPEVTVQNDFSKDSDMFFKQDRSVFWRRRS